MIPPDDDGEDEADRGETDTTGDDEAREDDDSGEDEPGDDDSDEDEPDEEERPPEREPGYLWTFEEQEIRLPDRFATHMEVLDEMEAPEILDLDLKRADDYLLWAAAQPYPAPPSRTGCAFVDELDSGSLKSGHDLRQTFNDPADCAVARFHSLNRRQRYPRRLR